MDPDTSELYADVKVLVGGLEEIKPCPNTECGFTDCYIITVLWSVKQVQCDNCGMRGPSGYEPDAIAKWNALPRAIIGEHHE